METENNTNEQVPMDPNNTEAQNQLEQKNPDIVDATSDRSQVQASNPNEAPQPEDPNLSPAEHIDSEKINFTDYVLSGGDIQMLGNSDYAGAAFLEDEDTVIKKLQKEGITDEIEAKNFYKQMKHEYNYVKDGMYSDTVKDRDGGNINDMMFGSSYLNEQKLNLFSAYLGLNGTPSKFANDSTYLDYSTKKVWNPKKNEWETKAFTSDDNFTNGSLIIDSNIDENGVRQGDPFIRELKPGETRIGKHTLSMFNQPDVYGSSWYDGIFGMVSGIVPATMKTAGQTVELFHNLVFSDGLAPGQTASAFEESNDRWINFWERMEYRPSDEVFGY